MGTNLPAGFFTNKPGPLAGAGLAAMEQDRIAKLELPGAQPPESLTILDGSISPTRAAVIVDTEGGAPADDLAIIATTLSDGSSLHDGMELHLQARDASRVVTVRHSAAVNGILTTDGADLRLSTEWWLILRLENGAWRQVRVSEPVGLASKSDMGVVRIGEGIEVDQGVISVPPVPLATDATPGMVRPDNVTCAVSEAGVLGGISMLCNTREVLTESGTYSVRVSGWYRAILIGGGQAGMWSDQSNRVYGGSGGSTTFHTVSARGGCSDGIINNLTSTTMGGNAGEVKTVYLYLESGTRYNCNIGAGGSSNLSLSTTGYSGNVASKGFINHNGASNLIFCGNGATNGTEFGGGGAAGVSYTAFFGGAAIGFGGANGKNTPSVASSELPGGDGGDGAVILEFYDPNKPTA